MDLVTVSASSVVGQSVVSPHGSIVSHRSSGVGAGVITEPIYVDSVGTTIDDINVSSSGAPPGLQLTTITVAVPAGPLSPSDHNMGASVGGIPVSVSGVPNALLHSAPLPTVPLPVVPAPPHECATLKWKHDSPIKEKNSSSGGLVSCIKNSNKV